MEEKQNKCKCIESMIFYDENGKSIFPHKIICTRCSPCFPSQPNSEEKEEYCSHKKYECLDRASGMHCKEWKSNFSPKEEKCEGTDFKTFKGKNYCNDTKCKVHYSSPKKEKCTHLDEISECAVCEAKFYLVPV